MKIKDKLLKKTKEITGKIEDKRTFKLLNQKLEARREELLKEFVEKHQETSRWLEEKGINLEEIFRKGSRGVLTGLAAGVVLLSSGANGQVTENVQPVPSVQKQRIVESLIGREAGEQTLKDLLNGKISSKKGLTAAEERDITQIVSEQTGIKVTPVLDGNSLNTNYGSIGLEQHLPLYPGQTLTEHFQSQVGSLVYGKSGMTRNRGAFGYFAPNQLAVTQQAVDEEKYYVVVQTFLCPGWGKKPGLEQWYSHRKVLVVNPENGRAVVGDIADSGPAVKTGKSYGGSPELMDQLGLYNQQTKGNVLVFFIDDTVSNPSLGPL